MYKRFFFPSFSSSSSSLIWIEFQLIVDEKPNKTFIRWDNWTTHNLSPAKNVKIECRNCRFCFVCRWNVCPLWKIRWVYSTWSSSIWIATCAALKCNLHAMHSSNVRIKWNNKTAVSKGRKNAILKIVRHENGEYLTSRKRERESTSMRFRMVHSLNWFRLNRVIILLSHPSVIILFFFFRKSKCLTLYFTSSCEETTI